MSAIRDRITQLKLIPVVAIEDAGKVGALADAVADNGLPCLEITFRTAAAAAAIRIAARRGDLLVGAGTVLKPEQVEQAREAGAAFVVTPGFNPRVVERCLALGLDIYPGISTPTDIEMALGFGLTTVKLFPAGAMGGVPYLKAIAAPYKMMSFIPTGGVSADNLLDYLRLPCVIACGGSWLTPSAAIDGGDFDMIGRLTREAVSLIKSL